MSWIILGALLVAGIIVNVTAMTLAWSIQKKQYWKHMTKEEVFAALFILLCWGAITLMAVWFMHTILSGG